MFNGIDDDPEVTNRLDSLCLSVAEHALSGWFIAYKHNMATSVFHLSRMFDVLAQTTTVTMELRFCEQQHTN